LTSHGYYLIIRKCVIEVALYHVKAYGRKAFIVSGNLHGAGKGKYLYKIRRKPRKK
jgi:hypothetical protein